jgi:hypothetical protein
LQNPGGIFSSGTCTNLPQRRWLIEYAVFRSNQRGVSRRGCLVPVELRLAAAIAPQLRAVIAEPLQLQNASMHTARLNADAVEFLYLGAIPAATRSSARSEDNMPMRSGVSTLRAICR